MVFVVVRAVLGVRTASYVGVICVPFFGISMRVGLKAIRLGSGVLHAVFSLVEVVFCRASMMGLVLDE